LTSPYSAARTEWVGTAAMGRPAKLELQYGARSIGTWSVRIHCIQPITTHTEISKRSDWLMSTDPVPILMAPYCKLCQNWHVNQACQAFGVVGYIPWPVRSGLVLPYHHNRININTMPCHTSSPTLFPTHVTYSFSIPSHGTAFPASTHIFKASLPTSGGTKLWTRQ
jgi:hypothetical protein